MKSPRFLFYALSIFIVACLHVPVSAQSTDDKNNLATLTASGSGVRWVTAPNAGVTMTVAAPDGRVFRKEFRAGAAPEFRIIDTQGERLPDGQYTYELRLAPEPAGKEALAARGKDDDPEDVRATRKRVQPAQPLVESGSFSILNGAFIVSGSMEEPGRRPISNLLRPRLDAATSGNTVTKNQQHHPLRIVKPDDVIPDDLVVQGSACIGLDCVDGEAFGFDTIRLKENNTRIQFDDTSAVGFPTNGWQIRANSSAAGGANFLAFVDQGGSGNSETGTILFEVDGGAPANSLKVSSTGRVGLRTATPGLDLHIATGDTPAHRLEQTSASGFTAQIWDVAGNEANFFVRDVTGGSRLPFRIRPGAPTSSIDISADGRVGIGIATPTKALDVVKTGADTAANHAVIRVRTTGASGFGPGLIMDSSSIGGRSWSVFTSGASDGVGATGTFSIFDGTASASRLAILSSGNVGIGTTAPTELLSVNGSASKPGGGSWSVFSDERLKNIKGRFDSGLKAVMQLQPLRYEYRTKNALGINSKGEHIGFGAQSLQKIIPEAVTENDQGYLLVNNDPIIWTMLNAIKEQQKQIEELKGEIRQLRANSRRHR